MMKVMGFKGVMRIGGIQDLGEKWYLHLPVIIRALNPSPPSAGPQLGVKRVGGHSFIQPPSFHEASSSSIYGAVGGILKTSKGSGALERDKTSSKGKM